MQVWPSESIWKNSNLTSSANTFLSLRNLKALRILFCWTHPALQLVQKGVAPPQRQRDGERKGRTGKRRRWRATGRVICTHQSCWLSRAGNGIQDPESHHQEAARKCCEIPLCPVRSGRFYSSELGVAFPGFAAHQQELQLEVLHTLEIRCQNEQQTFSNPMQNAGLNGLPRPTELLAGPCRTSSLAQLHSYSPHSKQNRHLWEKHPWLTCAPKPFLSTSLSCTRGGRGNVWHQNPSVVCTHRWCRQLLSLDSLNSNYRNAILHYAFWMWKSRGEKMEDAFFLESCLWLACPPFTESWCLLLQYIYFETQFICCKKLLRPLILEANAERSRMLRILIMLGLGNLMNKRDFS